MGQFPEMWACKRLRTKHFHEVSSGNQHPYLLKSRYGKVRYLLLQHSIALRQHLLTVRAFSKWFMRNSAKPSIHPRRETQQLQNALLERTESRQMAIDVIHAFNHRQRHILKRFKQPFGCRPSRFALAIAGVKAR